MKKVTKYSQGGDAQAIKKSLRLIMMATRICSKHMGGRNAALR